MFQLFSRNREFSKSHRLDLELDKLTAAIQSHATGTDSQSAVTLVSSGHLLRMLEDIFSAYLARILFASGTRCAEV